jgi:hypothetical protein
MERASVDTERRKQPRSNKYSGSDRKKRPPAGTRQRVWVGGYVKADGTKVRGYYRSLTQGS